MSAISTKTRGRKMTSVFCEREGVLEYVRPGARFRRLTGDETIETAEILAVYTDPYGVPHFRFDVLFEGPDWPTVREGPQVLSVKTFLALFQVRVEETLLGVEMPQFANA